MKHAALFKGMAAEARRIAMSEHPAEQRVERLAWLIKDICETLHSEPVE